METPQQIIQTPAIYEFRGVRALITYPQCNDGNKEELLTFLKTIYNDKIEYIVVCKENHHETDGEHYHAYIKFNTRAVINANHLTYRGVRPNLEKVSKTAWRAIEYVKKDGNYIEEGTSTDVKKLTTQEKYKIIKEKTYIEIFEMATLSLPELCKVKQIQRELIVNDWPMNGSKERKVYWFYGPTGTGKTRKATEMMIELYGENWVSLTGNLRTFFDPYNGEKGVIFDDIRKGSIVWNTLLTITDRYKTSVNVKGSRIPWLAETIIFTSPQHFEEVFTTEKDGQREQWDGLDQFARRITKVEEFN
uniref:ATP-dependent helicase Rep n=1 Tax=Porcine serum-associated circular virus TaxID=1891204 RepID=A0A160G5B5_9VIRU|nr:replication protein [Porcine serum-associated circular virus]